MHANETIILANRCQIKIVQMHKVQGKLWAEINSWKSRQRERKKWAKLKQKIIQILTVDAIHVEITKGSAQRQRGRDKGAKQKRHFTFDVSALRMPQPHNVCEIVLAERQASEYANMKCDEQSRVHCEPYLWIDGQDSVDCLLAIMNELQIVACLAISCKAGRPHGRRQLCAAENIEKIIWNRRLPVPSMNNDRRMAFDSPFFRWLFCYRFSPFDVRQ